MIAALVVLGLVALAALATSVLVARELRAQSASSQAALEAAFRAGHAERQDAMDRLMATIDTHFDSKVRIEQAVAAQAEALQSPQPVLFKAEEEQDREYIERRNAEALFSEGNAEVADLYAALGIEGDPNA